jgi:hypothetical protein
MYIYRERESSMTNYYYLFIFILLVVPILTRKFKLYVRGSPGAHVRCWLAGRNSWREQSFRWNLWNKLEWADDEQVAKLEPERWGPGWSGWIERIV